MIGTLRALGATGRQIQLAAARRVAGDRRARLGRAASWAASSSRRVLVRFAANTINTLMLVIDVQDMPVEPAIAGDRAPSSASSRASSRRTFRRARRCGVPPIEILRPRSYRLRRLTRRPFWAGVGAFGLWIVLTLAFGPQSLAALVSTGPRLRGDRAHAPGNHGAGRADCCGARAVSSSASRDSSASTTSRSSRTARALTATALAGTLAMMVASATLVEGFGSGTRRWMDEAFPFDLAITASDFVTSVYTAGRRCRRRCSRRCAAVPGVGVAYGVQKAFVGVRGAGRDAARARRGRVLEGARSAEGLERVGAEVRGSRRGATRSGPARASTSRAISRTGSASGRGGRITLASPSGPASFRVIRVVEDYSWPQGLIAMDRARYVEALEGRRAHVRRRPRRAGHRSARTCAAAARPGRPRPFGVRLHGRRDQGRRDQHAPADDGVRERPGPDRDRDRVPRDREHAHDRRPPADARDRAPPRHRDDAAPGRRGPSSPRR